MKYYRHDMQPAMHSDRSFFSSFLFLWYTWIVLPCVIGWDLNKDKTQDDVAGSWLRSTRPIASDG